MRILGAIALLAACAGAQPYVVSGESLKLVGSQFVTTAALMDRGLDNKSITPEQYKKWRDFGERFQPAFDLAVKLWETARLSNDKRLERQAAEIILRLAEDLTAFYDAVSK